MKAYRGTSGKAPLILNLGNGYGCVISITLRLLYPENNSEAHRMVRCVGLTVNLDLSEKRDKSMSPLGLGRIL
jgi:hypothetical protein